MSYRYTPEQVEEIKAFFKENDITMNSSLEAEIDLPPEKVDIFNRTKKIFEQYWKINLKSFGINQSMKNFSKDHPINSLMNVDSNMLSEVAAEQYDQFNTDSTNDFIDIFCAMYQEPLLAGIEKYAKILGKSPDDLTDEELHFVIDSVADVIDEEILNVVMLGQQVPELHNISYENSAIEDFNLSVKENHPKTDFLRKQYGLRRKFDSLLSFEELATDDLIDEDEFTQKKMIVNCLIRRVDIYRDYKFKIDYVA